RTHLAVAYLLVEQAEHVCDFLGRISVSRRRRSRTGQLNFLDEICSVQHAEIQRMTKNSRKQSFGAVERTAPKPLRTQLNQQVVAMFGGEVAQDDISNERFQQSLPIVLVAVVS